MIPFEEIKAKADQSCKDEPFTKDQITLFKAGFYAGVFWADDKKGDGCNPDLNEDLKGD